MDRRNEASKRMNVQTIAELNTKEMSGGYGGCGCGGGRSLYFGFKCLVKINTRFVFHSSSINNIKAPFDFIFSTRVKSLTSHLGFFFRFQYCGYFLSGLLIVNSMAQCCELRYINVLNRK